MITNAIFYSAETGEELCRLDEVEEFTLTVEQDNTGPQIRHLTRDSMKMTIDVDPTSIENFRKYVVYRGDRGRYNGYVLKRDGYLSPENAWLGKKRYYYD